MRWRAAQCGMGLALLVALGALVGGLGGLAADRVLVLAILALLLWTLGLLIGFA